MEFQIKTLQDSGLDCGDKSPLFLTRHVASDEIVGNFCEYFNFVLRNWTPKTGEHSRESAAREQLKELFGD